MLAKVKDASGRIGILIIEFVLYFSSNFLKSYWCKLEFSEACKIMKEGRVDYILAIILSNLSERSQKNELPLEINNYMRTFTYLDARTYKENIVEVRKRIRFAMPAQTIKQLRTQKVCWYCHDSGSG